MVWIPYIQWKKINMTVVCRTAEFKNVYLIFEAIEKSYVRTFIIAVCSYIQNVFNRLNILLGVMYNLFK